uniref:RNA polymerase alpha subunit n=2 Tax=Pelargonium TaxID=4030 RepID=A0A1B0PRS1_9ROSI|nr:RNA polymerase alpha subunit [Pelargonium exhibens]YP_009299182.1 RNA polymerase alpha subunit [Pelargonium exhibens]AJB99054.1 RNA polymerase alpha subunit [Pelargonium exhibens]AJB99097.1 RNA polymerase alpha subunit [Pelargonium exhibens]
MMIQFKVLDGIQVKNAQQYGRFGLSPLKNGEAKLLSLVLRQALLTSLVCACFTSAKIKNEPRSFYFRSLMVGIKEPIPKILSNLSGIKLKGKFDDFQIPFTTRAFIDRIGPLTVTARDIQLPFGLTVVDETQHIATLTQAIPFFVELRIEINSANSKPETGVPNEEGEEWHLLDAIFTPIRQFESSIQSYEYEGQTVEHLFLEIYTDSTITPYEALVQASRKMISLLTFFLQPEKESKSRQGTSKDDQPAFSLRLKKHIEISREREGSNTRDMLSLFSRWSGEKVEEPDTRDILSGEEVEETEG